METDLHKLRLRLAALEHQQDALHVEIKRLQIDLHALMAAEAGAEAAPPSLEAPKTEGLAQRTVFREEYEAAAPEAAPKPASPKIEATLSPTASRPLEKRIGENFSSIIGTPILVLGVSIGIKYAIDHDLISPLARIVLAYLAGLILFLVAYRLRPKYPSLSAVILGGAMAIVYFSTYAAHQFYQLMGQMSAFGVMGAITVLTVWQALLYQRQSIAIGGLVGAYSIPFLLSHGEDNPVFLFSYISIVNCGILYIAFQRNWRYLRPLAFVISWFLLAFWCLETAVSLSSLRIGLGFLSVFFLVFYGMWLVEKLRQAPQTAPTFGAGTVFYLFFNAFLYVVLGYFRLNFEDYHRFQGLFVLFNIALHLGVSYLLFRRFAQAPPFAFVSWLAIVLFLLFFPVQFDGLNITLGWAAALVGLFWIGRSKRLPVYEMGSLLLLPLLLLRLWVDNTTHYYGYDPEVPETRIAALFSPVFFTNILIIAAVVAVYFLHRRSTRDRAEGPTPVEKILPFWGDALIVIATVLLYVVFFHEISCYFDQRYADSVRMESMLRNEDLQAFKVVWLLHYTMAFVAGLNVVVARKFRQVWVEHTLGVLSTFVVGLFLTLGLYALGTLKNSYLAQDPAFPPGPWHLYLRYVSMALLAVLLWTGYRLLRPAFEKTPALKSVFDLVLHGTILWVAGSELIHWMERYGLHDQSYKMALSILFGAYALMMVFMGIQRNARHLRVAAIALFGATLFKLLLYDLAHLSTISKTIVLVSLGSLLLVISYLYNRFSDKI